MAPIVRILLRVLAGFLIGSGYFTETATDAIFNDPAFDAAIGAVLWGATEVAYVLAKRLGWRT
jgi:hypothetical protein